MIPRITSNKRKVKDVSSISTRMKYPENLKYLGNRSVENSSIPTIWAANSTYTQNRVNREHIRFDTKKLVYYVRIWDPGFTPLDLAIIKNSVWLSKKKEMEQNDSMTV